MPNTLSPQDALVYAMVTMSAVDRNMKDVELARIGDLVSKLPVFEGFSDETLVQLAQACGDALAADDGLNDVLRMIEKSLPDRLHETAYALAVEVAAADLNVKVEELRFLDLLRDQFDLDKLTCAAIERGARARHASA
ncbi:MAG: tellurite resistance TerB family protein [Hyphomicrobiaceae bacterium]